MLVAQPSGISGWLGSGEGTSGSPGSGSTGGSGSGTSGAGGVSAGCSGGAGSAGTSATVVHCVAVSGLAICSSGLRSARTPNSSSAMPPIAITAAPM